MEHNKFAQLSAAVLSSEFSFTAGGRQDFV